MINNGSAEYTYLGCYGETIALDNTAHLRALHAGADQVGAGRMTVPICLDFCGGNGNGNRVKYEYAGLEYSRLGRHNNNNRADGWDEMETALVSYLPLLYVARLTL